MPAPAPVLTRSYDTCRSGANLHETVLTQASVRQTGVRVLARLLMDGDARGSEGQPLVVPNVLMADGLRHNVILAATMGNMVYCWDFDTLNLLWARRIAAPIKGSRAIDMYQINDHWGILGTPAIDMEKGVVWVVAMQSLTNSFADSQHHIYGLDLGTGATVGTTVLSAATYDPGHGLKTQAMKAVPRKQRCGLALDTRDFSGTRRKTLFVANGSFIEDADTNQGWLTAIDVTDPTKPALQCSITTTARFSGGGIWMGGQAPIVDPDTGYIGITVGNGSFDGVTDFGESVVKYVYTPAAAGQAATLKVDGNATWYTDTGRVYGQAYQAYADDSQLPRGTAKPDAGGAPKPSNMNSAGDEDLNSGGPLLVTQAMSGLADDFIIIAGKDGIGYVFKAASWPRTQLSDFKPENIQANVYAKATWIGWLTYYNPTSPTPIDLSTIPTTFGQRTHHMHGTCVFYRSPVQGPMIFCWGENGNLRAFRLNPDGTLTYLACSMEVASPNAPVPWGGMPGGMITLSANGATAGTALIHACVPYGDANKQISPGRYLIYDAENFARFPDGSGQIVKLWDSQDWGVTFFHSKFNQVTVTGGRVLLPSYDGSIVVLG